MAIFYGRGRILVSQVFAEAPLPMSLVTECNLPPQPPWPWPTTIHPQSLNVGVSSKGTLTTCLHSSSPCPQTPSDRCCQALYWHLFWLVKHCSLSYSWLHYFTLNDEVFHKNSDVKWGQYDIFIQATDDHPCFRVSIRYPSKSVIRYPPWFMLQCKACNVTPICLDMSHFSAELRGLQVCFHLHMAQKTLVKLTVYDNAVKSCQTHQFSLISHFLFPWWKFVMVSGSK